MSHSQSRNQSISFFAQLLLQLYNDYQASAPVEYHKPLRPDNVFTHLNFHSNYQLCALLARSTTDHANTGFDVSGLAWINTMGNYVACGSVLLLRTSPLAQDARDKLRR
jgi:hypothetical protein